MKLTIKDLQKEITDLREENYQIKNDNREFKSKFMDIYNKYEKQLEKENQFMKELVLHLTSKPIKITDKDGNTNENWREAGHYPNVPFYHQ